MMSENKRNLTEKEEYYKLITDEKSNHIGTNANGAGSQCVRRKNTGNLSFRERYLSTYAKDNAVDVIYFSSMDRMGRAIWEVLESIKFCLDNQINCIFQKEGMSLYLDDGTENPFLAIFCSVISTCAKVERDSIKFRLNDARRRKIELALSSGKTLADVGFGRPKGSIKTKERKEQEYAATIKALKRGLSLRDAAKISNVSVSTCQRIKKEFAL